MLSVGLCLLVVVLFDLVAYPLLSPGVAARFHPYRCPACVPPPAIPGWGVELHDYYLADEERGFDIAPNRRGMLHYVDGTLYPVWSNALGCFDVEPRIADRYVYLAGDSFAWPEFAVGGERAGIAAPTQALARRPRSACAYRLRGAGRIS
jgi:hypothetical protein